MPNIDFLNATNDAVKALDKAKAAFKFSEEAKASSEEAASVFYSALAAAKSATKESIIADANADSYEKAFIDEIIIIDDSIKGSIRDAIRDSIRDSSQIIIRRADIKIINDSINDALAINDDFFNTANIAYSKALSMDAALIKAEDDLKKANDILTKAEADSNLALTLCENAVKKANYIRSNILLYNN